MEIDAESARQGRKGKRTLTILAVSIVLLVVGYTIFALLAGDNPAPETVGTLTLPVSVTHLS